MSCSRETETLRAAKTDAITAELQRHLAECAECSDTMRVAIALSTSGGQVPVERGYARIIWLLAAERRHAQAEQKLARVVRFGPVFVVLLVAVVAAVWALLTGHFVTEGLLEGSGKIALVFLIAAVFVVFVVWTAPVRGRSS